MKTTIATLAGKEVYDQEDYLVEVRPTHGMWVSARNTTWKKLIPWHCITEVITE